MLPTTRSTTESEQFRLTFLCKKNYRLSGSSYELNSQAHKHFRKASPNIVGGIQVTISQN